MNQNSYIGSWGRQFFIKFNYPKKGEMLWMGDGWKHSMDFISDDTPKLFNSKEEAIYEINNGVLPYILQWQPGWDEYIEN